MYAMPQDTGHFHDVAYEVQFVAFGFIHTDLGIWQIFVIAMFIANINRQKKIKL